MTLWQGTKAELVTAVAAAVALPFYLGLIHLPPPQLFLYSGVAGAAMATGEYAESPRLQRGGWRLFIANTAVWSVAIGFFGGAAYLMALIF
jgi:hypothetical protein